MRGDEPDRREGWMTAVLNGTRWGRSMRVLSNASTQSRDRGDQTPRLGRQARGGGRGRGSTVAVSRSCPLTLKYTLSGQKHDRFGNIAMNGSCQGSCHETMSDGRPTPETRATGSSGDDE